MVKKPDTTKSNRLELKELQDKMVAIVFDQCDQIKGIKDDKIAYLNSPNQQAVIQQLEVGFGSLIYQNHLSKLHETLRSCIETSLHLASDGSDGVMSRPVIGHIKQAQDEMQQKVLRQISRIDYSVQPKSLDAPVLVSYVNGLKIMASADFIKTCEHMIRDCQHLQIKFEAENDPKRQKQIRVQENKMRKLSRRDLLQIIKKRRRSMGQKPDLKSLKEEDKEELVVWALAAEGFYTVDEWIRAKDALNMKKQLKAKPEKGVAQILTSTVADKKSKGGRVGRKKE